jgi:SNF2 family DNA or RNA helicase
MDPWVKPIKGGVTMQFYRQLYDFQEDGSQFLYEKGRAVCADDMGLGKTTETLAAWTKAPGHTLVVCLNSNKFMWQNEIHECLGNQVTTTVVKGTPEQRTQAIQADTDFVIINYEGIQGRNYREEVDGKTVIKFDPRQIPLLCKGKWSTIVFDEAHMIKNRQSQTFKAAKMVVQANPNARVYFLTGTPVLNRAEELWPLLHLIDPKQYRSFWNWVDENCYTAKSFYSKNPEIMGVRDPQALKDDLKELLIRRTKDTHLNLPPKIYQDIPVELTGKQRSMYDKMEERMFCVLENEKIIEAETTLAQITRLKQICVSPSIMDPLNKEPLRGAKLDALMDLFDTVGDQKMVIFSQFATAVERLTRDLTQKHQRRPHYIASFTGKTKPEDRDPIVRRFQENDDCRVLLTTFQAGGTGLTYTAGSVAVFLDLLWTPKLNDQAADRLHRIGQKNQVTIVTFNVLDSIESDIRKILRTKEALFQSIIPQNELINLWLKEKGMNKKV